MKILFLSTPLKSQFLSFSIKITIQLVIYNICLRWAININFQNKSKQVFFKKQNSDIFLFYYNFGQRSSDSFLSKYLKSVDCILFSYYLFYFAAIFVKSRNFYFSVLSNFCFINNYNTSFIQDSQMERQSDIPQYQINFDQAYLRESSIKEDSNFKSLDDDSEINPKDNSIDRKSKKTLQVDQISTLFDKKANLQNFIEQIGEYSIQPIRQDIFDHCEKISAQIPINLNKYVVMKLVKNRVDKMIKNKRIKKNWSEQDINILIWVISKYCQFHGISNIKDEITEADWINIARLIPGVTGKSCMFKWLSLKKSNLAQNSWVEEQSLLLDQIVKKYGDQNWCRISQQLYLSNPLTYKIYRCPKQCREHWNCYLNPKLKKGPWERKQDFLLLRAVKQLQGVKKWAEIVKMFNGRTENALKNRFTLIVQKELKQLKGKKKNLNELQLVQHYLKKHQNQYSIDDAKLKFLSDRRQLLNQNQLKRKPKKVCPKKVRQEVVYSEQEQYIPEEITWRDRKINRQKPKARQFQKQIQQRDHHLNIRHQIARSQLFDRQQSFNRMGSVSIKKQDPIFQQEQEMEEIKQQGIKQQYKPQNQIFAFNQMRMQCFPDEHTHEQNMGFQSNGIKIVPFSNQFIRNLSNRTLIPCRMTGNFQIYSIRMQKND